MAGSAESSGGGFFGLFKKKASEPAATIAPVDKETVLDTFSAIAPALLAALEDKLPVRVLLGNSSFSYYTHFEWELLDDGNGLVVQSKTYLEEGQYLLLATVDPPIGNLKIRSAGEIRLEFASKYHRLECETSLQQITPAKKLRMSFPKSVLQKPQQRLAVRVPVERNTNIVVTIVRPSGIVFEAKFRDISATGASFYPTGATPRIADHARVQMAITYPEGNVEVDAVILGAFVSEGELVFRAQFLVASHQSSQQISAAVAYVQRCNIQRRKETLQ
ncbi:PilZ domain-containing protein [Candidatus Magnetaquicoccus inordinatus]|uniref:PilZ domain-containing protein n=1 Tax=Candidatus Magnetaquicoccus inordinatus TaxID=2496818 RepID=UPI00102BE592|nr:PilZ domain-containing protein [Candidatus Magnetaquicoccus inordinatus]